MAIRRHTDEPRFAAKHWTKVHLAVFRRGPRVGAENLTEARPGKIWLRLPRRC